MKDCLRAYALSVFAYAWVSASFREASGSSNAVEGLLRGLVATVTFGLVGVVVLALLLLPAMVATVRIISWQPHRPRAMRIVEGAVTWVLWGLALATAALLASGSNLDSGSNTGGAGEGLALALAGALFGALVPSTPPWMPGRRWTLVSAGIGGLVGVAMIAGVIRRVAS